MKVICVIPARLASKRLPQKVLAVLAGKPLIQHTYEKAKAAGCFDRVLIACDHPEISKAASSFGAESVLTSPSHESGTSRIREAVEKLPYDLVVNLQGDEPLAHPDMLRQLVESMKNFSCDVGTLAVKSADMTAWRDPHVVKVVLDHDGFALYFSRAPIPHGRDQAPEYFFKHLGLYAYRRDVLMNFPAMKPSRLEQIEQLEQLRFLLNGYRIRAWITTHESFGVDTPADLARVEAILSKNVS